MFCFYNTLATVLLVLPRNPPMVPGTHFENHYSTALYPVLIFSVLLSSLILPYWGGCSPIPSLLQHQKVALPRLTVFIYLHMTISSTSADTPVTIGLCKFGINVMTFFLCRFGIMSCAVDRMCEIHCKRRT